MDIEFRSRKLERMARDERVACRKLGERRAGIFFRRLQVLYAAESFADLRNVPGRFHELRENRKGQWSFDLDQPYRLIVVPRTVPIAVDADGRYVWEEIRDAVVVEIVDYHNGR